MCNIQVKYMFYDIILDLSLFNYITYGALDCEGLHVVITYLRTVFSSKLSLIELMFAQPVYATFPSPWQPGANCQTWSKARTNYYVYQGSQTKVYFTADSIE